MENNNHSHITPPQYTGNSSGASAEIQFHTREEALINFLIARQRLMNVNMWYEYSGISSGSFQLTGSSGQPLERDARTGDYIKIDIPGPGPRSGDGYDWVKIEAMEESGSDSTDEQEFAFLVRPAAKPGNNTDDSSAHFYTKEATSTFVVKRKGNTLTAFEEGRNEIPNTDAKNITDKIRNTIVAVGASHGFSYPQWKMLMEGILGIGR